ncbi:MAG: hypothetical protein HYZ14_04400 [Bacteroidetes bacterium]|nr:hypothetical protein [Bacteroidota bacterium]
MILVLMQGSLFYTRLKSKKQLRLQAKQGLIEQHEADHKKSKETVFAILTNCKKTNQQMPGHTIIGTKMNSAGPVQVGKNEVSATEKCRQNARLTT